MALTQDERIEISQKLVEIPLQNKLADQTINQIADAIATAQKIDNANKGILFADTLIEDYHAEFNRYDGSQARYNLTEQHVLDSVNRLKPNMFFPNRETVPLPGVPDGIWKNFQAYSQTIAIGKDADTNYLSVRAEIQIISDILTKITDIEAEPELDRNTGYTCDSVGTGGQPQIDTIMQQNGTDLINLVTELQNYVTATQGIIPTIAQDPDAARQAQNDIARNNITTLLNDISTWQAYPDYNPPPSGNCPITTGTYTPSKFRATELDAFKLAIQNRQTYLTGTRIPELDGHFGTIVQDYNTGELVSSSGWYGKRYAFIEARVNAIGGSLSKLISLQNGSDAQQKIKNFNNNLENAYSSIMLVSAFKAPGLNNESIHVESSAGFNVGDIVYVCAKNQQEIAATIVAIDGNRIVLDTKISKKYRKNNLGRVYKVL